MRAARNLLIAVVVSTLAACTSGTHRVTIGPEPDSDTSLDPLVENPVDPRVSSEISTATSGSVSVTASSVASSPVLPGAPGGPAPGTIIGGGGSSGLPRPGTGTTTPESTTTSPGEPSDSTDPDEPTTTQSSRLQTILITTPADWHFPDSATITVSASSGLTDFTLTTPSDGACAVDDADQMLLRAERAGACTVTVVQAGDERWARAEASATIDIEKGVPVFSGDGDQTFEYRPAALPYPLTTTSTAGAVEHATTSPLCAVAGSALGIDLDTGMLPVLCEITASSPETADYLAATTTFTVGVEPIHLLMQFGPVVRQPDGITATVDATTPLPPDLGFLLPVFAAEVDDPVNCELVPPVAIAFGLSLSVVNRSGGPITCVLTASVVPDRYFSGDGSMTLVIDFGFAEPPPV